MKLRLRDESVANIAPQIIEQVEAHVQRKNAVVEAIRNELQALRPAYPSTDPQKQANYDQAFLQAMTERYEFAVDDATGTISLFEGGSRLVSAQGYPVTLAEAVRLDASSRYELFAKESPAPQGAPTRFKNEADYIRRWSSAKSVEERSALVESWRKQQQTA